MFRFAEAFLKTENTIFAIVQGRIVLRSTSYVEKEKRGRTGNIEVESKAACAGAL
jgi:hypothetical protein